MASQHRPDVVQTPLFPNPPTAHLTSGLQPLLDLPPMNDNCATYVLSVMMLYLRQTHTSDTRYARGPDDRCFIYGGEMTGTSGEPLTPPCALLSRVSARPFQRTQVARNTNRRSASDTVISPYALNGLLAKFDRVIIHISASNWPVVFNRLHAKLHYLAGNDFGQAKQAPDLIDVQLLSRSALNRERLLLALQEVSGLILSVREEPVTSFSSTSGRTFCLQIDLQEQLLC
ncbi:hypothetical protein GGX14DRAFT_556177 [Mycena pura]|uniref:Uncharacterized protein n=1 Tax=Mycena pura TaxID=153505 RepID=A0AAD6YP16_9AGAR|nr:hypothetical protein GGX14DRAFT_556177 [Mycena pura]